MHLSTIVSRKARILILLAIIFVPSLALLYAAIVFDSRARSGALIALLAWTAIALFAFRHAIGSLFSGPVTLQWDGNALEVSSHATTLARIEGARWVYWDRVVLVLAPDQTIGRFDFGHVRSNGRELTVDGFFGSGIGDLPTHLASLGPRKHWLWRRMPF